MFLFKWQCYCSSSSVRATELWLNPAVTLREEGGRSWANRKACGGTFQAAENISSGERERLKKKAMGDLIMVPQAKLLVRAISSETRKSHNWKENRGFILIPQCLGALWMGGKAILLLSKQIFRKVQLMIYLGCWGHWMARAASQSQLLITYYDRWWDNWNITYITLRIQEHYIYYINYGELWYLNMSAQDICVLCCFFSCRLWKVVPFCCGQGGADSLIRLQRTSDSQLARSPELSCTNLYREDAL